MNGLIISEMKKATYFSYLLFLPFFLLTIVQNQAFANSVIEEKPAKIVYALAAPFTTITDNISLPDFSDFWSGTSASQPETIPGKLLIVTSDPERFRTLFGEGDKNQIEFVTDIHAAFSQSINNGNWLIVPFEQLDARFKVISIDEQNPLHKDFNDNLWPLTIRINGNENMTEQDWAAVQPLNRDPSKLTTMILTGVTALVRGTAAYMDVWGPEYPASNIGDTLREADILHVNNEVPFAKVCQQTESELARLVFCSKTSALELLKSIGTDVVELDGDHFQDYGDDAVYYTLKLYKDANIPYYGGGANLKEAQKPLIVEDHGNKFAFIGCNGKEIGYAVASDTRPGAAHCDIPLIVSQIKELKASGILPIVTFQHIELYKIYPNEDMAADFKAVADAGAVIVSGSQSHIPMAFDISKDSFIHYGLGNLFFDQAFFLPETSEATLDRHVFYNGKHISTEILTIKFTNNALNRFMTESERTAVLNRIFAESHIELDQDER
ncbi:MAG: Capsule biosynthesis protein CapA [Chloroflexi bacterium ADurb.Bin344]|nr:MAG: Capsule biosynthesis protein CapA [Chloroflexi bacterium ADurb.Bin344]